MRLASEPLIPIPVIGGAGNCLIILNSNILITSGVYMINSEVIQIGPLESLAAIQKKIKSIDSDIASLEVAYGIDKLRKDREDAALKYDVLLKQIVSTVTFHEDQFLKALKKSGDSYREGHWKLLRTPTNKREVRTQAILKVYPDLIKIASIPVGRSEKIIGETELNKYCTVKTSYAYELQDLSLVV